MNSLVYFSILLLIPLVPAVVIYRTLPTESAHVAGTFHGMRIKLSGAFAAYFALVLIGIVTLPRPPADSSSHYQVWRIKGTVTGADPNIFDYERDLQLRVNPFGVRNSNGTFTIDVLRTEDEVGRWEFPTLSVEGKGYLKQSVDLNDKNKVENAGYRELRIKKDFALKPVPTPTPSQ
jgi:hypothetical protein